jgi:hypothetical protein
MQEMRREFTYTKNDRTLCGVLVGLDCLVGPLSVSLHEGELCYTYLAGSSQAGCDALFLKQEIDGPVTYHHERLRFRIPPIIKVFDIDDMNSSLAGPGVIGLDGADGRQLVANPHRLADLGNLRRRSALHAARPLGVNPLVA